MPQLDESVSADGFTVVDERLELGKPWVTVVWDDPVNLQNYVAYVFRSYFQYSADRAWHLMMQVHTEGRAIVAHGARETMERHVIAMHGYGLQATLEPQED